MPLALDVDLLRTFIAIAETGSFTRAAEEVHKTQSAVSMQMKRLEDTVQKPLFVRDGRRSRLTADGERLLDYARRIVSLNNEAMSVFTEPELSGLVRMGTPDDYADRLLPEVLARFSRTHPMIQVDVECLGSQELVRRIEAGSMDLAVITCDPAVQRGAIIRWEPLVWVTSARHRVHEYKTLPVALSHHGCSWRTMALDALEKSGRDYRVAYASANSQAVGAAVLEGLAIGATPEITMRPGMRVLTEEEGFPALGEFAIGLMRRTGEVPSAVNALAEHVTDSFSNLGTSLAAE